MNKEFRYIGSHPGELEGGRPLASGDYTGPIDPKATQNAALIEAGDLIECEAGTAERVELLNAAALNKGSALTDEEWGLSKAKLKALANDEKEGTD